MIVVALVDPGIPFAVKFPPGVHVVPWPADVSPSEPFKVIVDRKATVVHFCCMELDDARATLVKRIRRWKQVGTVLSTHEGIADCSCDTWHALDSDTPSFVQAYNYAGLGDLKELLNVKEI